MRKPAPPPRVSRVSVPERCHPAAKLVFAEMNRQNVTYEELAHYSGVQVTTIKAWRTNNRPGLETMEAALGALGWSFLPVPREDKLPPAIRDGVKALAAEWEGVNPILCQLMATVARAPVLAALPAPEVAPPNRKARRSRQAHPDQAPLFEDAAA